MEEKVFFKWEFVVEYLLSKMWWFFVEGYYLWKLSGEKMYGSYYYDFYFKEYLGMGIYCMKVIKFFFLYVFE